MPSSIINSDDGVISGTSGLKTTGGDDGVLVFQSKGTETAQINTDKQIVAAAGTASLPIYSTTGDLNTGIYFPAADNIGFATNGVIRGRWTNDGLCFNTDTAAANALDDYEEGTWTPTTFGATSAGTGTYTRQVGRYVKVGNIVTATAAIITTAHTGTGFFRFGGLPFTSKNTTDLNQGITFGVFGTVSLAANNIPTGYLGANSTDIVLLSYPAGGGTLNVPNIDPTIDVAYSITYIAE